ncbi:MAG: hypothetical protein BWY76_02977 [bacterium ADurb.Bin429]|nr:MAG: hypothetical protein BWY76_02977 [bacterium ADurb.Bin429]
MLDNLIVSKPSVTGGVVYPTLNNLLVGNTFTVAAWPVRPRANPHPAAATLQQELPNAFDNDPSTEFVDAGCNDPNNAPHPVYPGVLQWNSADDARKMVVAYTLTAGSDATKDPRDFRLLGANAPGGPWTVLDTQTRVTWPTRATTKTFTVKAPGDYSVYRLEITANTAGTPSMRVAEFALLDAKGADLTEDRRCLVTTRNEAWGIFYALDKQVTMLEKTPVPTMVGLPATPKNRHRKIIEVRINPKDDASAVLQAQINAAAQESAGSKPVVHIPKGKYTLNRTVTVPALSDLQLIGDGVGNGTALNYGGGDGPLLRLVGPSRATLRDLELFGGSANGVDGLVIEHADQDGGHIYTNQLWTRGAAAR